MSEASGGQEETPRLRDQGWPGEATSHLVPETRGSDPEEPPRARGQGPQSGGATLGAVAAGGPRGAIPH